MGSPLVSIVVPIHNVERYVKSCLRSIARQTYSNLEIVCVDDRGSDNSMLFAEECAARDSRYRLYLHPRNLGVAAARNTGLSKATGEYVLFVDADDWLHCDAIAKTVAAAESENADMVWFKWLNHCEDTDRLYWDARSRFNRLPGGGIPRAPHVIRWYPMVAWNKVYRRAFLQDNGLAWPVDLPCADTGFFFESFALAKKIYLVDEYLYYSRQHRTGPVTVDTTLEVGPLCEMARRCRRFLGERGVYERFAPAILDVIGERVERLISCRRYKSGLIRTVQAMLSDVGFPEVCRGGTRQALFTAIRHYRRPGWLPSFQFSPALLEKLVPLASLRYWIMVFLLENDEAESSARTAPVLPGSRFPTPNPA